MRKHIFALAALVLALAAGSATAQSVGATQIKKKTGGGLVADSANALAIGLTRGASAPASPVAGQLWLDTSTTPATLRTYNGSAWETPPSAAAVTVPDLGEFPPSPTDGQITWISSLKRAIVYDEAASAWYYLGEINRRASTDYNLLGKLSSAFLTPPGTAPTVATGTGSSTAGTHVCAATFFNSTGGETMVGPSSATVTTTAERGIAVSDIPTGGAGTAGRRVWCSRAGTTIPLYLVGTLADNTTTTLAVSVATNAALIASSPDVDFSAPIPSGWTFRAPNSNDLTYGGCGSTGTTLLCVAHKFTDQTQASSSGIRLTYGITDDSGEWSVTLRVVRAKSGFPFASTITTQSNSWLSSFAANDIDAPFAVGLGEWASAVGGSRDEWTDDDAPSVFVRQAGAVWTNTASGPAHPLAWTWAMPMWARLTSTASYSVRWEMSSDAENWSPFAVATPPSSTYVPHVGIALERVGSSGSANTTSGQVIEIDTFIVEH